MKNEQRLDWADRVLDQVERQKLTGETAIMLARKRHREHAYWILLDKFGSVEVPMYGLTMGRQLSWLAERT